MLPTFRGRFYQKRVSRQRSKQKIHNFIQPDIRRSGQWNSPCKLPTPWTWHNCQKQTRFCCQRSCSPSKIIGFLKRLNIINKTLLIPWITQSCLILDRKPWTLHEKHQPAAESSRVMAKRAFDIEPVLWSSSGDWVVAADHRKDVSRVQMDRPAADDYREGAAVPRRVLWDLEQADENHLIDGFNEEAGRVEDREHNRSHRGVEDSTSWSIEVSWDVLWAARRCKWNWKKQEQAGQLHYVVHRPARRLHCGTSCRLPSSLPADSRRWCVRGSAQEALGWIQWKDGWITGGSSRQNLEERRCIEERKVRAASAAWDETYARAIRALHSTLRSFPKSRHNSESEPRATIPDAEDHPSQSDRRFGGRRHRHEPSVSQQESHSWEECAVASSRTSPYEATGSSCIFDEDSETKHHYSLEVHLRNSVAVPQTNEFQWETQVWSQFVRLHHFRLAVL